MVSILLSQERSSKTSQPSVEGWAYTVKRRYDDPLHPSRQVGGAEPDMPRRPQRWQCHHRNYKCATLGDY